MNFADLERFEPPSRVSGERLLWFGYRRAAPLWNYPRDAPNRRAILSRAATSSRKVSVISASLRTRL